MNTKMSYPSSEGDTYISTKIKGFTLKYFKMLLLIGSVALLTACGGGGGTTSVGDGNSGDNNNLDKDTAPVVTNNTLINGNYYGDAYSTNNVGSSSGENVKCEKTFPLSLEILDGHVLSTSSEISLNGKIDENLQIFDGAITYQGSTVGVYEGEVISAGADSMAEGEWEDKYGCYGTFSVNLSSQAPIIEKINGIRLATHDTQLIQVHASNEFHDIFNYSVDNNSSGVITTSIDESGLISINANEITGDTYNVVVTVSTNTTTQNISFYAQAKPLLERDNVNEVVYDSRTGLTWQDNIDSKTMLVYTYRDYRGEPTNKEPNELDYCQNLNLNNVTEWRVPTLVELKSLYDAQSNYNLDRAFENYENENNDLSIGAYISSTIKGYTGGLYHYYYTQALKYNWTSTDVNRLAKANIRCVHD